MVIKGGDWRVRVSMGEYIELDGFSSRSSSSSDVSVFNRGTGYNRLHSGVGSERFLTSQAYGRNRVAITSGAYQGRHLETFAGQLGQGLAGQIEWFPERNKYYRNIPAELKRLPLKDKAKYIKPYDQPWNDETRAKYPRHWSLVNQKATASNPTQPKVEPVLSRGQPVTYGKTLPFSNNIGPGNSVQPALTNADLVAQGHDLHYQFAKKDSDVLSADREAISQFAYEAISGSDPISQLQAGAGAIGLGIKHLAESALGKVIYGGKFMGSGFNGFVSGCLEQDHWDHHQMNDPIGVD